MGTLFCSWTALQHDAFVLHWGRACEIAHYNHQVKDGVEASASYSIKWLLYDTSREKSISCFSIRKARLLNCKIFAFFLIWCMINLANTRRVKSLPSPAPHLWLTTSLDSAICFSLCATFTPGFIIIFLNNLFYSMYVLYFWKLLQFLCGIIDINK